MKNPIYLFLFGLAFNSSNVLGQTTGLFTDTFEPDDTPDQAKPLLVGDDTRYQHTLHSPADEDWLRFDAKAGSRYTITALNMGNHIDIKLSIYNSKGELLDLPINENPEDFAKSVSFMPPVSGDYFVQVQDTLNLQDFRANFQYEIKASAEGDDARSIVKGRVFDATFRQPLADINVCQEKSCIKTDKNGYYQLLIPIQTNPNSINLVAGINHATYKTLECRNIPISANTAATRDFPLLSINTQLPSLIANQQGKIELPSLAQGCVSYYAGILDSKGDFYLFNPDPQKPLSSIQDGIVSWDIAQNGNVVFNHKLNAGLYSLYLLRMPGGIPDAEVLNNIHLIEFTNSAFQVAP